MLTIFNTLLLGLCISIIGNMPVRMLTASVCNPVGGRIAMIKKIKRVSACNMCQPDESTKKYESAILLHAIELLFQADVIEINPPNHGPEGRSLYCLNLNCRAPPGRFLQQDLSFR